MLQQTLRLPNTPIFQPMYRKHLSDMMKEANKQSDIAWEKAKPIIAKEAKQGKPYIPWAARPNDLPQADILAFPGAEGGGAYSFGGQWWKSNCSYKLKR